MTAATITHYETLIFDCDGVVLDSNDVKTEAFVRAAAPFGQSAADRLRSYHLANGGISRYNKFEYFISEVLEDPVPDGTYDLLLECYSEAVLDGLQSADVADGLNDLRSVTEGSIWVMVSGGDQDELRRVLELRGLSQFFDGGIFGSPRSKEWILRHCEETGVIRRPAVFIGDSRYDHEVSTAVGHDFIFVSGWSDFEDWEDYQTGHDFPFVQNVKELVMGGPLGSLRAPRRIDKDRG